MRRVLLLGFIWGWSFLFIKVSVRGVTPATTAAVRTVLGAAVLLAFLRLRRQRVPWDRTNVGHYLVMGVVGTAFPFVLFAWAHLEITTSLASVLNATIPLMASLIGMAVGDRLRPGQIVGLLLGFGGVAVAAGVGGSDLSGSALMSVAAALLATTGYGLSFVYAARRMVGVSPLEASAGQLVMAAAFTIPLAVVTSVQEQRFELTGRAAVSLVLLGVLGTGYGYVLNYRNIADMGATKASVVTYVVPVTAVAVGLLFLDEPFHWRVIGGAALVVGGLVLVQQQVGRRTAGARLRAGTLTP